MNLTLTRIDPVILGDHYYLTAEDECYFLREYTARGGFDASETNQIIQNLKKPLDRRGRPEWVYKERDLQRAASELRAALNPAWLRAATIVLVRVPADHGRTNFAPTTASARRPANLPRSLWASSTTSVVGIFYARRIVVADGRT